MSVYNTAKTVGLAIGDAGLITGAIVLGMAGYDCLKIACSLDDITITIMMIERDASKKYRTLLFTTLGLLSLGSSILLPLSIYKERTSTPLSKLLK